jgi:hypothetical protein
MLTIASIARAQTGGHPLWHLVIVAGGAIVVFVVIKTTELLHARPNRIEAAPHKPRSRSTPTLPVLALALASAASGAIHASVSADHFQEAFIYGAFFLAASTLQAGWAVLIIYRPTRTLLVVAAATNAAIMILWTVTRTVGLPIGPQAWRPEPIGALDATSTLLEFAIVIGAVTLLAKRVSLTAPDAVTQRLRILRAQHPTLLREHDNATVVWRKPHSPSPSR